mgnify:CR=1 FL=1
MIPFRSQREILFDLITRAYEYGLLSDDTGFIERISRGESIENNLVLFLSAVADELARFYSDLEGLVNSLNVDLAVGDDLDRLAALVGLERLGATKSIVPVVFERMEGYNDDIFIPAGTGLTTKTGVAYETLYEAAIPSGSLEARSYAISRDYGLGTRIGAGELNIIEDDVPGATVYNPEPSSGGNPPEDDASLRMRVKQWAFEHQKGTLTAYYRVLQATPGVNDFIIEPRWDGPGTVRIVVDPPDKAVLELVQDYVRDAMAADEDVKVVGVETETIDIECVVSVKIETFMWRETIAYNVEKDIRAFIDGGRTSRGDFIRGLGLGEDFSPFRLGSFLTEVHSELSDLEITYPAKKVNIPESKRAKAGQIKVTVV